MPSHPTFPWWMAFAVVPAILALRAAVFHLVPFVLSRLGWAELARAYPVTAWTEWPKEAAIFLQCAGRIGRLGRYGSLGVIVAREGIHVSMEPPAFRRSHPSFVLPWAGVQSVAGEGAGRAERAVIRFSDAVGRQVRLDLPADALAELRAAGGRSFA